MVIEACWVPGDTRGAYFGCRVLFLDLDGLLWRKIIRQLRVQLQGLGRLILLLITCLHAETTEGTLVDLHRIQGQSQELLLQLISIQILLSRPTITFRLAPHTPPKFRTRFTDALRNHLVCCLNIAPILRILLQLLKDLTELLILLPLLALLQVGKVHRRRMRKQLLHFDILLNHAALANQILIQLH